MCDGSYALPNLKMKLDQALRDGQYHTQVNIYILRLDGNVDHAVLELGLNHSP